MELFSSDNERRKNVDDMKMDGRPLAERLRPTNLSEVFGQNDLTGSSGALRGMIDQKAYQSFLLWGPPGTGKTSIAQAFANETNLHFVPFSAVLSGIKEVRDVMTRAAHRFQNTQQKTLVFIDEIHRFNKAQQDAFLPYVERGEVLLVGATTENPSFEVNAALLSRLRVLTVNELSNENLEKILIKGLQNLNAQSDFHQLVESDNLVEQIAQYSQGDARNALNILESCFSTYRASQSQIKEGLLAKTLKQLTLLHDKSGENHFNTISALHKSIRNGDADAGLYWLGRMLEAGEDPMYIARRLVRFASEDIGNADPFALTLAMSAQQAVHFIGMPEGKLALAQLTTYLAAAPKSNASYRAYQEVAKDIQSGKVYSVPLAIRNAPTRLMKELDYGKDYQYAHGNEEKTTSLQCLPDELEGRIYYQPTEQGREKQIKERLDYWKKIRTELRQK